MRIVAKTEDNPIATVYIAETDSGKRIECVESVQPPVPREDKWVLIVSTLFGCPVGCPFCDAGGSYKGQLSADDIMGQIDFLVRKYYPDGRVPIPKFKIQFARMGEPALNPAVLTVLESLPKTYDAPGLMPTLSTVAPAGAEPFFRRLLDVKNRLYKTSFQLQFSIHTTDPVKRDWMIPIKKWSLEQIAAYGEEFHNQGERKVTLNFAMAEGIPLDPSILHSIFSPDHFFIKLTPVNPTCRAEQNGLKSVIRPDCDAADIMEALKDSGYDVLLSIGEWEENRIGSNCGQYITYFENQHVDVEGGYVYPLSQLLDAS